MRITALRRSRRARHLLSVELDDGRRLTLPDEVVVRLELRVGRELAAADVAALEVEESACLAQEAALRMLARRGRTRAELARRLEARGHDADIVAAVVHRLVERGFVDDDAVATEFVRARIAHRPRGPRMLAAELRAKGLDEAAARAVVDRVLREEGESELDTARRVADRWLARNASVRALLAESGDARDIMRARQRLQRHLVARGFSGAVAREVARSRSASVQEARSEGKRTRPRRD